jgi:hypothetical protein
VTSRSPPDGRRLARLERELNELGRRRQRGLDDFVLRLAGLRHVDDLLASVGLRGHFGSSRRHPPTFIQPQSHEFSFITETASDFCSGVRPVQSTPFISSGNAGPPFALAGPPRERPLRRSRGLRGRNVRGAQ